MIILSYSGGVDSTFSLLLLKKIGYKNIICVYIKIWNLNFCKFKGELNIVKKFLKKMKIILFIYNCEKLYINKVFKPFLREYKNGKTPNSDVFCNPIIKFKVCEYILRKKVLSKKNIIITGHHSKVSKNIIKISKDIKKDQSYFLYRIKKNTTKYLYFPIGFFTKNQIKKTIIFFNLKNRRSSRGMCFVENKNFSYFISNKIGKILYSVYNFKGKKLGKENFYKTIGQKILFKTNSFYIYKKDRKKKIFFVNEKINHFFLSKTIKINKINIFTKINFEKIYLCKKKNTKKLIKCKIISEKKSHFINFLKPEIFSIGQSVVFYIKKKLIFGGIICEVYCKNFTNY